MQTAGSTIVERSVAVLCRVVLWVTTTIIFAILVANTILRYVTGSSLQWANEVPELLFPWLVMAGVVLAALHGAHIATTFMMDAVAARTRRIVSVVSWLVVAGMYSVLAVATFRMLEVVHDEKTPILQLPGSLTYACVMSGMGLLAVLAIQSAWRSWHAPTTPEPAADEHAVPVAHW
jgi:TRAP-type C4-dicarboxylate transport system permease small subunit